MNIDVAKNKLIQYITEIQNEFLIRRLLALADYYRNKSETEQVEGFNVKSNRVLELARMPTPESVSIEKLKKEQRYSTDKLKAAIFQIDYHLWADENTDELLAAIK
jgi:hypothetical protein